jgi:hypothetical protein
MGFNSVFKGLIIVYIILYTVCGCKIEWAYHNYFKDVLLIFLVHCPNPFGFTMAVGSTQPLTEMITKSIFWGLKAASAQGWQPGHLHVLIV